MSETKEIALIGTPEAVKAFVALGVAGYESDLRQVRELFLRLANDPKYGVIFISEDLAKSIMVEIEKIKQKDLPAVFILPAYKSQEKIGLRRLENTLSRAIGKKLKA